MGERIEHGETSEESSLAAELPVRCPLGAPPPETNAAAGPMARAAARCRAFVAFTGSELSA